MLNRFKTKCIAYFNQLNFKHSNITKVFFRPTTVHASACVARSVHTLISEHNKAQDEACTVRLSKSAATTGRASNANGFLVRFFVRRMHYAFHTRFRTNTESIQCLYIHLSNNEHKICNIQWAWRGVCKHSMLCVRLGLARAEATHFARRCFWWERCGCLALLGARFLVRDEGSEGVGVLGWMRGWK